ncbi:MAG: dTMP kinase [Pseudomonadota bacterium]
MTLEGVDGAGKSTQARLLADRLRERGHAVTLTREPGGAPGAEAIRALLVTGEPGRWSPETEALLFTAARRDHVERVIAPAMAEGQIVLCDRFVDSTRAYQAAAARQLVDALHAHAIGIEPDLTLILELSPESALARATSRGGPLEDRFEQKGLAFQKTLAGAFRSIAEAEPERCHMIDANAPADAVIERLWRVLEPRLPNPAGDAA